MASQVEEIILEWSDNDFVQIFTSVTFPSDLFNCESWGELNETGIPVLIETEDMYSWFEHNGYPDYVIIDHTMTVFDKPPYFDPYYINGKIQDALDNCEQCISTQSVEVSYDEGWNLIGLPLEVEDGSYTTLYPEAIEGTLYSYNDGYESEIELTGGNGYWLRFTNSGNNNIAGTFINELTISISVGWNLISGTSEVSTIIDPSGIIISGSLYGYDDGYFNADELEPGKAYWVRANADGEISIINIGNSSPTHQIKN